MAKIDACNFCRLLNFNLKYFAGRDQKSKKSA